MKRYIKPQVNIVLLKTAALLIGSGGTWDPNTQTQEGKEGFTPVSEDNANALWEE